jgi:hypothetical protein
MIKPKNPIKVIGCIEENLRFPEQTGPGYRTKLGHPNGAKWAIISLRVEKASV